MSVIGHFHQTRSGGWEGQIRTLTLNVSLRLSPNDDRANPKAPAFRAMVGRSHVGDAWERMRRAEPPRPMLRVVLDDPSLAAPIDAALFPDEAGDRAVLVWQRPLPQRHADDGAEAPQQELRPVAAKAASTVGPVKRVIVSTPTDLEQAGDQAFFVEGSATT